MKRIDVVAAVIRREKEIFATQRGYGEFKEELDAEVNVGNLIKWLPADKGILKEIEKRSLM